jgi:hypothetical protein
MKRIGIVLLIGSLYGVTSAAVWADSGKRPIEHSASHHSIERALLMSAENQAGNQNGDAQTCRMSCDEVKGACNGKCVGVTAGSCFARCANEHEACLLDCGGKEGT